MRHNAMLAADCVDLSAARMLTGTSVASDHMHLSNFPQEGRGSLKAVGRVTVTPATSPSLFIGE